MKKKLQNLGWILLGLFNLFAYTMLFVDPYFIQNLG